jgi:propanol-preferring alcohol dehydrogenase
MLAMVLERPGSELQLKEIPTPVPKDNEVLIEVSACAVCRTDLHVIDGELRPKHSNIIPGHQIVGKIVELGKAVKNHKLGDRVGVTWLAATCGICDFCKNAHENLCEQAKFTGYDVNGGFAQFCVARADFCLPIPSHYNDIQAAPLLCAGIVGYRAYSKVKHAKKIGFYGFGSAAHILIQFARMQGQEIFVFTREGDVESQNFAIRLGATWAGASQQKPPEMLDAAIIFAPVGDLIPLALAACNKGATVVAAGIHMSEIPAFSYDLLWGERCVCSIANLTRQNGIDFLSLTNKCRINTEVNTYRFTDANKALNDLRGGNLNGSAVLVMKDA